MLEIDLEKCTKCKACVHDCPSYVLEMEDSGPVEKYPENCNECGHCVAICPVGAIVHERMDIDGFPEMQEASITFDQFLHLSRNRRSIRNFKKEPVSNDHVQQLLESVRYIPTAENAQELEYLVITNPARIDMIRNEIPKYFKMLRNIVKLFYFVLKLQFGQKQADRARNTLNILMEKYALENNSKKDFFMHGAPSLVIIHVPKKKTRGVTSFVVTDAGIASYHLLLACETLGIGTCWSGFHTRFSNMFKSFRKISLVPDGHVVLASILMGYPAVKYKRDVYRRPLRAKLIGPDE